jgi:hypothetical protein
MLDTFLIRVSKKYRQLMFFDDGNEEDETDTIHVSY